MPDEKQTPCRGCGALIFWIETPAGKKCPLDVNSRRVWIHNPETDTWELKIGYSSHFETCPKAKDFRKGKTG